MPESPSISATSPTCSSNATSASTVFYGGTSESVYRRSGTRSGREFTGMSAGQQMETETTSTGSGSRRSRSPRGDSPAATSRSQRSSGEPNVRSEISVSEPESLPVTNSSSSGDEPEIQRRHAHTDTVRVHAELFDSLLAEIRSVSGTDHELNALEDEAAATRVAVDKVLSRGAEQPLSLELKHLENYVPAMTEIASKVSKESQRRSGGFVDWRGYAADFDADVKDRAAELESARVKHQRAADGRAETHARAEQLVTSKHAAWAKSVSEWIRSRDTGENRDRKDCPPPVTTGKKSTVALNGDTFRQGSKMGETKLYFPCSDARMGNSSDCAMTKIVKTFDKLTASTGESTARTMQESSDALRERLRSLWTVAKGLKQREAVVSDYTRFICGPLMERRRKLEAEQRRLEGRRLVAAYIDGRPTARKVFSETDRALREKEKGTSAETTLSDVRFVAKTWRGSKQLYSVARYGPESWQVGLPVSFWNGEEYVDGEIEALSSTGKVRVGGKNRPVTAVFLSDVPHFWPGPVQGQFLVSAVETHVRNAFLK